MRIAAGAPPSSSPLGITTARLADRILVLYDELWKR